MEGSIIAKKVPQKKSRKKIPSKKKDYGATRAPFESEIEEIFYDYCPFQDLLVPQYKIGDRRLDFAIPQLKIAIELDGKEFHSSPAQKRKDLQKDLNLKGWHIFRFDGTALMANMGEECYSFIVTTLISKGFTGTVDQLLAIIPATSKKPVAFTGATGSFTYRYY